MKEELRRKQSDALNLVLKTRPHSRLHLYSDHVSPPKVQKFGVAFKEYRRPVGLSCACGGRTTNRLLGSTENGGLSHSIEMSGSLPPRYVDFKEQIRTEMFSIKHKMNDLRQLHGR
jgi:hypothetical protein